MKETTKIVLKSIGSKFASIILAVAVVGALGIAGTMISPEHAEQLTNLINISKDQLIGLASTVGVTGVAGLAVKGLNKSQQLSSLKLAKKVSNDDKVTNARIDAVEESNEKLIAIFATSINEILDSQNKLHVENARINKVLAINATRNLHSKLVNDSEKALYAEFLKEVAAGSIPEVKNLYVTIENTIEASESLADEEIIEEDEYIEEGE